MYRIDFLSAECYPAAKVGGLADVVGALPKYINEQPNHRCNVIMPLYGTPWFENQKFQTIFKGSIIWNSTKPVDKSNFIIKKVENKDLEFDLYCVDIPELFDRNGVYSENNIFFEDEPKRNLAFQRAYLEWILKNEKPDIIHCHDHHTGLVPYMLTYSTKFKSLSKIPTIFTIHNGQYHGAFSWDLQYLVSASADINKGLMDWSSGINSLSSAIRCAWKITTVSPTYMSELQKNESYFQELYIKESAKSIGILNGIDYDVWNPKSDDYLDLKLDDNWIDFKKKNKKALLKRFKLKSELPLFSFIGRFAEEKGVDIIANTVENLLKKKLNILILGTGDSLLEDRFREFNLTYKNQFHAELKYDEKLAHEIYAGSDFLLMPSRVEPCGLNQMYAMRYGTLPIVHGIGGLEDTVKDFKKKNGNGIKFYNLNEKTFIKAIDSAIKLFENKTKFKTTFEQTITEDFSWNASCQNYLNVYYEHKKFS